MAITALVTAVTVGPGLIEKWNDTTASIDMGSIDPKKPFSAPLEIKNASTIFDMHSPEEACTFSAVYSEGLILPSGGTTGRHALPGMTVPVKSSAIFFCDFPDKFKFASEATGKTLTLEAATLTVSVKYATWIVLFTLERQPPSTTFTLLNTSTGYQWVKGTLIK
jgi:hypothetical protein